MPILTRRRDPEGDQELIHYDDIRVGSIANATRTNGAGEFASIPRRMAVAKRIAKSFDAAPATFDTTWQWLRLRLTEADFHRTQAAPRLRCVEARDVGRGLEAADASSTQPVHVLLRGGDRDCGHRELRLCRSHSGVASESDRD
jgi:hypothetical protein